MQLTGKRITLGVTGSIAAYKAADIASKLGHLGAEVHVVLTPSAETFVEAVVRRLTRPRDLKGKHVIVTAGATREPLDPVRFLSNRSSGKMGFALAEAARDRGAQVTVIAAHTSASEPAGVEIVRV